MKHIPNILTSMRIALCIPLLFIKPLSLSFFILYVICGTSDILDGYIARKTGSASKFGAMLDSVADAVMTGVLLVRLIPIIEVPLWIFAWILCIALIRLSALVIGFFRYHTFSSLHTYANKATGLVLFCSPFLISLLGTATAGCIVCILASLSALEELIITITSRELVRDVKSIIR